MAFSYISNFNPASWSWLNILIKTDYVTQVCSRHRQIAAGDRRWERERDREREREREARLLLSLPTSAFFLIYFVSASMGGSVFFLYSFTFLLFVLYESLTTIFLQLSLSIHSGVFVISFIMHLISIILHHYPLHSISVMFVFFILNHSTHFAIAVSHVCCYGCSLQTR